MRSPTRLIPWLILCLVACAPCPAAEPKAVVVGKTRAFTGSDVFLNAAGSKADPDFPIEWQTLGSNVNLASLDTSSVKGGAAVLTDVQPGVIRIAAIACGMVDGRKTPAVSVYIHEILVVDPNPTPPPTPPTPPTPPNPTPIPPIPPTPTPPAPAGKLYVTLLWTAETDTQASILTRVSQSPRDDLQAMNASWNTLDLDTEAGKRFVAQAGQIDTPLIIVQDATGKVYKRFKPSNDPKAVAAAVKELRP